MKNYLGNINLDDRPVVEDGKGGYMTELSFGFAPDENTEVLIPQVVNGKLVSKDNAIKHFFTTGQHLGTWDMSNVEDREAKYKEIDVYANSIHELQGQKYSMQDAVRRGL